jgi:hypothetical protein
LIQNQNTPGDVTNAAEGIDDVRTHFTGDIVDVVRSFSRPVDGPVAEVTYSFGQTIRQCIGLYFIFVYRNTENYLSIISAKQNRIKFQTVNYLTHEAVPPR